MTDPELTITEPPPDADEATMLVFAIERSRAQFAWKTGGLDTEALHRAHPPSAMTLAGLIKHVSWAEDLKMSIFVTGEPMGPPWDAGDVPDDDWSSARDDSAEDLYALWRGAVERSRAAVTAALAARGPGGDSAYKTRSGRAYNLRRALVDLHDEYARHVGHADLFREAIDGRVGEDPPQ